MGYATLQALIDRFTETELSQVADPLGTGEIDQAVIDRALADADAEIDGALIGRYLLPLQQIPLLLVRIACDLARESLYIDSPPKEVTSRAERARALLASIAKGVTRLDLPAPPSESSVAGLVEIVSGRRHGPFSG